MGKGSVDFDGLDPLLNEALSQGLRRGGLAITGEASAWREVGWAMHVLNAGFCLGSFHLDIAENQGPLIALFQNGDWIANGEPDPMEKGSVGGGNSGEDSCCLAHVGMFGGKARMVRERTQQKNDAPSALIVFGARERSCRFPCDVRLAERVLKPPDDQRDFSL